MSSSYKQKKMKTLATRKKTRKRRIDDGMALDDIPVHLLQQPSTRDPLWKKPLLDAVVSSAIKSKRQKKAAKKRRKLARHQNEGDNDQTDVVQQEASRCDEELMEVLDENLTSDVSSELSKTPSLELCSSLDDVVNQAALKHAEIRLRDGRQKARVLLLVDTRSIFKVMKKKLNIRSEMVKAKSKRGVGSGKKPEMAFKNIGLVKTPLDRYKGVNKSVLAGYKSGKLSTILAQDLSFYPYIEFKVQHVIFVAKEAASAINLDPKLLHNVQLHRYVINDSNSLKLT
ncbi:hypothetical protein CCR75_008231 [Bremia lactucae]|uniref:Uncharacterized protein n=1 Tax=Bremia lactucae TaxID=4779 RepID=A0A976FIX2_BRELC|nr:hypothetical protein CCR75_008231 [Bremia lactucae]